MKKYLLPTLAIVALAGCGSAATKVASGGTIEDRRTPITVPVSLTAPTTVPATTPPTFTEYVPTTVVYADLGESGEADDQLLGDMLSDIVDVIDDVVYDIDGGYIEALMIDCSTGVIRTMIAQNEVDTYTGPKATALNRALDEYSAGFTACSEGDFEAGGAHMERGAVLMNAATALL